jgi:hypothetical protein
MQATKALEGAMSRNAWTVANLSAILTLALCAGCGDGRPERVPVSGQILIDGAPLTYGSVLFHSKDHRPAIGSVDASGRFQLSTYEPGDGCVPGSHAVSIDAGQNIGPTSTRWHAPKKYRSASASGIVVTVEDNMEPVEIQLSWDGGKPFIERIAGGGD